MNLNVIREDSINSTSIQTEMETIKIEDIQPDEIHSGSIESKVIWVSNVKTTQSGNRNFRYFQRILLADSTANILGLITTSDKGLLGDSIAAKVGRFLRIPLIPGTVKHYNSRFSVGEHVNGAELWFAPEDIVDSEELETVEKAEAISPSIPFHFRDFTQLGDLKADSPFDVVGTVLLSEELEDHRPPDTEIQLRILGGTINLAVWREYSDILKQAGGNGEPLRVAIKGVRKLNDSVNANTHVGSTADIFLIHGEDNLQIFDENNTEFYRQTFQ